MVRTVIIQKHQTLIDLALQYCGNAEALFTIAELNDLQPTQDVTPGMSIFIPDAFDSKKVKYLTDGAHKLVTAIPGPNAFEGLDYWALELDFILT